MKMTNGIHVIETTEFLKNIWERDGFKLLTEEPEAPKDDFTYLELKTMAKEKGINTHGMKKEEIFEALNM